MAVLPCLAIQGICLAAVQLLAAQVEPGLSVVSPMQSSQRH
jgi:hypothetical protein